MAPSTLSSTNMAKNKVGSDGLTRSQRYYRNHPEVKIKNRERERQRRQRLKVEKQLASPTRLPPVVELSNAEAITTAQASSTTDGAMSTTRLSTTPVPATEARPPPLASPFIHTSTPPSPAPAKPMAPPSKKPRFPEDFFSTRIYNRGACYGEALNVLQDDRKISRCRKVETLKKFELLQSDALTWCCGWGGVAYWHISLHESYTVACEEERSNKWEEELLEHAGNGRRLLFELTAMVERLLDRPREAHKLKELLRVLMEMVQMVTMGLTVLNMRCSILPNNLWGVERLDLDSSSEEGSCSPVDNIMDIECSRDFNLFHSTVDSLTE